MIAKCIHHFKSHFSCKLVFHGFVEKNCRPQPGNFMDLRAEMDLLVALSACPDLEVGGKPVDVSIYEP